MLGWGKSSGGKEAEHGGTDPRLDRPSAWRDLDQARHSRSGGFHEWACFAAQQAAEKALKAVYQALGGDAWGHSVLGLLEGLSRRTPVDPDLWNDARDLDRYYIPARYPNGWAEGAPKDMFTRKDADHAIGCAERILRFCDGLLAGS